MIHYRQFLLYSVLLIISLTFTSGCSSADVSYDVSVSAPDSEALRDPTPNVLIPEAPGLVTYGDSAISLDASNISQGYLILTYNGSNEKVKLQFKSPDGTACTYLVTEYGQPLVYPLTGGDGTYSCSVFEAVDADHDKYAMALTQALDVTLEDEFLPFLYPNVYVDFSSDTKAVAKGEELAEDCFDDLDVVGSIYHYVTGNISYDEEKAQCVTYGYTPDVDDTLASGKGICFDYASLMTCMLRTQRIPTQLEVGYVGEVYHAWISCYVDEIGWIDNIIEFDGQNWSLMDPTLAASNTGSAVKKYIGDGSNYLVKYTY